MALNRIIEIQCRTPSLETINIENLRIEFEATKTIEQGNNTALVKIYNLSSDTRRRIEVVDTIVSIRAGYEDERGAIPIFYGNVVRGYSEQNDTERITYLELSDSVKETRESNISISYDSGINLRTIVSTLANNLQLPISNASIVTSTNFVNGYSFIGKTKDCLSEVLGFANLKYTIQNNEIVIYKLNQSFSQNIAILSPNSGLVGYPEQVNDIQLYIQDDNNSRIKLKALILYNYTPGNIIQLESRDYNGQYTIERCDFFGDNWDGDFICELEVVGI